ncbi:hypothetical protein D044_4426B, partial [Vibrio parahaemolyticus EKP-026]
LADFKPAKVSTHKPFLSASHRASAIEFTAPIHHTGDCSVTVFGTS